MRSSLRFGGLLAVYGRTTATKAIGQKIRETCASAIWREV